MFNIIRKEIDWCGKKLSLETGKLARQADGAVVATVGETSVLCTVVASKKPLENVDFFPLTVIYRELTGAAGKIPGGFFKREGRPSEYEVLTSRLIDRPIRPLFPNGFSHEVQIICTLLSYDGETDTDVLSMIGASAALTISGLPFMGPIAGVRVGIEGDNFVANTFTKTRERLELDLMVAATKDSIIMVESEANEITEQKMLEALEFGYQTIQPVIELIHSLDKAVNKPKLEFIPRNLDKKLLELVSSKIKTSLVDAYSEKEKAKRYEKIAIISNEFMSGIDLEQYSEFEYSLAFKTVQEKLVRDAILKGKRIDARDHKSIRPIATEVSVLPRAHGSALFTRGETQALVTTTLGSADDEQMVDSLDGMFKENFMLHYNFPPYSVGEAYPMRAPGRREVGHGKLAWRALRPVLPTKDEFSYTIRTVSEITSCNGSSSMATVCGASLSLMDAGVPLKSAVAGIAMGLIMEENKFVILSDILGDEDHLGDMDFKVAGTKNGITALQMDIKIEGVNFEIMKSALAQALEGRLHILEEMDKSISEAKKELSKYAPTITRITINKNKIGAVIGQGGKNIKEICEKTGAKVDISDDGVVSIAACGAEASEMAISMINGLVFEPEIGKEYEGKVTKILDFGAVVAIAPGKEGLLHISEIQDERLENIRDVLNEGDSAKVRVLEVDERKGRIRLSMKSSSPIVPEDGDNKKKSHRDDRASAKSPSRKPQREKFSEHKEPENKASPEEEKPVSKKKYFNF
jgi:polyribonucleotide nucleotidyltransferase